MGDIDALAAADQPDSRRLIRLVELFVSHLLLHAWGEETFYYPAVAAKAGAPPLTAEYMSLLDEEHRLIDTAVRRLETEVKQQPPDAGWRNTYAAFKNSLANHMRKEEVDLFPMSESLLGARGLEEISNEVERRRSEAPRIGRHSPF